MTTRSHTSRSGGPDLQPYAQTRNNDRFTNDGPYSYHANNAYSPGYAEYPPSGTAYPPPTSQYHISSNAGKQDDRGKHGADEDRDDSGRHDNNGDPGSGPPPPPRRAPDPHETATIAPSSYAYSTSTYVLDPGPRVSTASPQHPDYVPRYQGTAEYQGPSQGSQRPRGPSTYPQADQLMAKTRENTRTTARKRPQGRRKDADTSDDDDEPVHFFVPGETIDVEVLAMYLLEFIDPTARIRPGPHPADRTRTGYTITAKSAMNASHLRELVNDSKDWNVENNSRSFKKEPYRYKDSSTWRRRMHAARAAQDTRKS